MKLKLKTQIYLDGEIAFGPGKAALLRAIEQRGSISEAAKSMDMSYRRAWLLVDVMNRCFREPLVVARPGRGKDSGAQVTSVGSAVLELYSGVEEAALDAARAAENGKLGKLLLVRPKAG